MKSHFFSRHFVGSRESTFSFRIQEEREIMGFQTESTFDMLCPDGEFDCTKGSTWKIVWPPKPNPELSAPVITKTDPMPKGDIPPAPKAKIPPAPEPPKTIPPAPEPPKSEYTLKKEREERERLAEEEKKRKNEL